MACKLFMDENSEQTSLRIKFMRWKMKNLCKAQMMSASEKTIKLYCLDNVKVLYMIEMEWRLHRFMNWFLDSITDFLFGGLDRKLRSRYGAGFWGIS